MAHFSQELDIASKQQDIDINPVQILKSLNCENSVWIRTSYQVLAQSPVVVLHTVFILQ